MALTGWRINPMMDGKAFSELVSIEYRWRDGQRVEMAPHHNRHTVA